MVLHPDNASKNDVSVFSAAACSSGILESLHIPATKDGSPYMLASLVHAAETMEISGLPIGAVLSCMSRIVVVVPYQTGRPGLTI